MPKPDDQAQLQGDTLPAKPEVNDDPAVTLYRGEQLPPDAPSEARHARDGAAVAILPGCIRALFCPRKYRCATTRRSSFVQTQTMRRDITVRVSALS